jgi:hypothetical protein
VSRFRQNATATLFRHEQGELLIAAVAVAGRGFAPRFGNRAKLGRRRLTDVLAACALRSFRHRRTVALGLFDVNRGRLFCGWPRP